MQCKICKKGKLEKKFNFNEQISYLICPNCNCLSRYPDNLAIDYFNDYMDDDKLSKSKSLAKYYYNLFEKTVIEKSQILEIGGSFGFFSMLMKTQKNCLVRNIELSKHCSDFANKNGVPTFNKIEDLDIKTYDFIFSFHVIEHIEPQFIQNFLQESLNLLKPNGKFILLTPNASSAKINLLKSHYQWLAPDEHICFQSPESINYLINSLEYECITYSKKPAYVHYPINSIIAKFRNKISNKKFPTNKQNSSINKKFSIKQSMISFFKSGFHIALFLERFYLYPFYAIYDLLHPNQDELVIIINKKNP